MSADNKNCFDWIYLPSFRKLILIVYVQDFYNSVVSVLEFQDSKYSEIIETANVYTE